MLIKHEQGMGLLEVLIALLLLAVAVLGFSAMQMRAINATDETLTRSDAMVIIRNVAEDLRLYPTQSLKQEYMTAVNSGNDAPSVDCATTACTPQQQAQYNAALAVALAKESNINVSAEICPGSGTRNIQKLCLIASWNDTVADMKDTELSCANEDGVYKPKSSCIIMETY